VIGIFTATILELVVVICFSKKIQKIKYKKQITVLGLVILAALILLEVL